MKVIENYSLLKHNTFGIDACCSRFIEYSTVEEAQQVATQLSDNFIIIGGGSNLLLTRDYEGTVVRSSIKGCSLIKDADGEVLVRVGSGEEWDSVVALFVANGWYGAENLSLIPGDVGASAVQNIGAYGTEVCDLIHEVEMVCIGSGEIVKVGVDECQYGYRQSRFKTEWKNRFLITHVTYRLSKQTGTLNIEYGNIRAELERRQIENPTLQQLRDVIIDIRNYKLPDPKELGNAGSFFMNPVVGREQYEHLLAQYPDMPHYHIDEQHEKIPAGWLIEQAGWKGRSLGPAGVHDRQALVLVNRGGATGGDIVRLCQQIQKDVLERFGIQINPEVNII
jgi:UDP-N-acetylmuramate dehydrogenase